jgi:hypothetical protein
MVDYFESIAKNLLDELNVIKDLVKKHNPTIGTVTEEILRKFLKKHLPDSINVGQGFIRNNKGETSKQCDILIYHSDFNNPFYKLDDLVVIPAESVIAIIEVKTTINSAIFHDAIDYFNQVLKVCYKPAYLFIYNSADIPAIASYFNTYEHKDGRSQFDHDTFQLLPVEITGINSSYHLKQDYVVGDRDEMGYSSFVFINEAGTEINALQHFYMSIYDRVANQNESNSPINSPVGGDAYQRKSFKAYWAFGLFDM